ncbi:hypothetical protein B0H13DRAFT_2374107 [Mycena leptocephala]|nr:hypothetical protein B0H13DRAFT_2374107 [Mycena leptocephala]
MALRSSLSSSVVLYNYLLPQDALRQVSTTAAFVMVSMMQATPAGAVCASGQMAVGSEFLQIFTGPNSAFNVFSGFLMANNCGLISQNGETQDENQMCSGGYNAGASVTCDGNHLPLPRWTRRATIGLARLLLTAAATLGVVADGSLFWLAATAVKASIVTLCRNFIGL